MRIHDKGKCSDSGYGQNCDGKGHYMEDPYAADIYNDHTRVWLCDGQAYGLSQDI